MNDLRVLAIAALVAVPPSASVLAQQYPSKPIRFITPFAPGGGTDIVARIIGKRLAEAWGQQVVIENRPGAQGGVGTQFAARAAPDGYTIVLGEAGTLCINAHLYGNVGYDALKDFAPIALMTQQSYLIVVHPSVPARSVKELIVLAKANPDKFNFGGGGAPTQIIGELFKLTAGISMTHIPYKGQAPAMIDLLGGHLDLMFSSPSITLPFARSGRIRALAVTGPKRSALLPLVPTVAESGFPGFAFNGWFGLLAPAGAPTEIVARLNAEVVRILTLPDVKESIEANGVDPVGNNTPEEFAAYINAECIKWGKAVKVSGVKAG
ncbi:MAG: tripartite tricarboxylate transporter substrate binding protein [Betaproteobacteria bacterium]|nr:tripartite tricarboxylate transporter substrate binding protein [Betaproteobacteria bacterium]